MDAYVREGRIEPRVARVEHSLRLLIGLVFIAAGVMKAAAPFAAGDAVVAISAPFEIGSVAPNVAVALLVLIEISLGLFLCLRSERMRRYTAVVLLAIYSIALVRLRFVAPELGPGCFGGTRAASGGPLGVAPELMRNGAMMWILAWSLRDRSRNRRFCCARTNGCMGVRTGRAPAAPGFTLLELLVTVAVISIIISILLPVLGKSKERAEQTVRLTYHKQFIAGFVMYGSDSGGLFPYFSDPVSPLDPHWIVNGYELTGGAGSGHFVRTSSYWPSVFANRYVDMPIGATPPSIPFGEPVLWDVSKLPGEAPAVRFVGPGPRRAPPSFVRTYFVQTYTTVAAPEYFVPSSLRLPGLVQLLRAQRFADVSYPSHKGLLRDIAFPYSGAGPGAWQEVDGEIIELGRISAGMVDGSAAIRSDRIVMVDGAARPLVLYTPNGIRGRDF